MAKIRVHELSKETGTESKEIIAFLQDKNVEVKNHMSAIDDEVADLVRSRFGAKKAEEKPAEDKADSSSTQSAPAKKEDLPASDAPAKAEKPAADAPGKAGAAPSQEAPRKKKLIRVVRPENTQRGSQRPQQGRRPQGANRRPVEPVRREPNRPTGPTRPIAGQRNENVIRPGTGRHIQAKRVGEPDNSLEEMKQEVRERQARAAAMAAQAQPAPRKRERKPAEEAAVVEQVRNEEPVVKAPAQSAPAPAEKKEQRREQRPEQRRESRPSQAPAQGKAKGNDQSRSQRRPQNAPAQNDGGQKQGQKGSFQGKKGRKDRRNQDFDQFEKKSSGAKKAGAFQKPVKTEKPKEESIKMITVPATITIQELADKMKLQPSAIVKKLFMKGTMVTINQEIEYSMAEEIALDFDVLCEPEKVVDYIEELLKEGEEDESTMVRRSPVVCVMGHVDHGKTSLLDAIRHTNVIDKEAGGITQHIGAYVVTINGENITFLDTPGHEAFTAMRMRGASSTDIAILVVAADDGVMPQTVEAINHAKAAGVEIIVAVNKIDKPGANVDRVKQELSEYELIPEDWGGKTVFVPVSAKTGEGLETLLEMILLTADILELKADPNRTARGLVLEAQLDKGRGPVATVLIQKGTLHVGDPVAAGVAYGKVRAMIDDKGRRVKEAGPSTPVEILGLNDVPGAGDVFIAPKTEREARNFAETFISQRQIELVAENKSKLKMSLDDLYAQIQEGNLKELGIIVKADVQGSVEAVRQSLEKLSNDEVVVKVIHGGVGAISESDVTLASASNAIIIGFNVRPDAIAKDTAEREGVDIRLYRVIYNAIEDIEAAMKGMLEPEYKEEVIGHAEVRQIFHASGVGTIAGSYVTDGHVQRDATVRLIRDGVVVFEGGIASLRRFKDDVKDVRAGYECAFVFENYSDVKEGDQVEAFKMVEVAR